MSTRSNRGEKSPDDDQQAENKSELDQLIAEFGKLMTRGGEEYFFSLLRDWRRRSLAEGLSPAAAKLFEEIRRLPEDEAWPLFFAWSRVRGTPAAEIYKVMRYAIRADFAAAEHFIYAACLSRLLDRSKRKPSNRDRDQLIVEMRDMGIEDVDILRRLVERGYRKVSTDAIRKAYQRAKKKQHETRNDAKS
jgi:hypothetical protein